MATKTVITNHCDLCDVSDEAEDVEVVTHRFTIDGKSREIDTCSDCFGKATLADLLDQGRRVRAK